MTHYTFNKIKNEYIKRDRNKRKNRRDRRRNIISKTNSNVQKLVNSDKPSNNSNSNVQKSVNSDKPINNSNSNVLKLVNSDKPINNSNSNIIRKDRRNRRRHVNTRTRIVYNVTNKSSKSKKMRSVPIIQIRKIPVKRSRNIHNAEPEEKKSGCGCGR